MRIIFSGGGTGGHIYPALAIREALIEKCSGTIETAYIGVTGGMEEKLASRIPEMPFLGVRAQGMPRTFSLKWFSFPFMNLLGISDAIRHLKNFRPELVVTTGGFVAFPTLMAAKLLGIPAVIHEQNAAMGVTNRIFAGSAVKVLLTYASAAKADGKRIVVTGNPVRKSFLEKKSGTGRFQKKENDFWLLSVGGSRGALSLNKTCIELVKGWLPKKQNVTLLHISGERDFDMVKGELSSLPSNYVLLPYLHEMKEAFDAADLIISRAGATILSEIAVCGKPAILIPFPFATDNHQEKNARVLEDLGAAKVVIDSDLSAEVIAKMVDGLIGNECLREMSEAMKKSRPAEVENGIVEEILKLLPK